MMAMNEAKAAVVADVDVLVFGGTTGACAAALAAAEAGCRVLVATPRTHLGEDLTSFLRLAETPGELDTILSRRIFGKGVPTPMHVKETLERELLHAGVELLYRCHPGGGLFDADGRIAGGAILSRAGRHVIRARAVIDATWSAVFARQADARFRNEGPRDVVFEWTLSAPSAPEGAKPAGVIPWNEDERTAHRFPLWRHTFALPLDPDDPASLAAAERAARLTFFRPDQFFEADHVFFIPSRRIDAGPGRRLTGPIDPARIGLEPFLCKPGLVVLSAAIDADDVAVRDLLLPAKFMATGRTLGSQLAAALPPRTTGNLEWRCRGSHPVAGLRIDGRDLRGSPAVGLPVLNLPAHMPVLGETDILVAGAGTAGAPAGIAVGREGKRALVIEALSGPGGLGTWGQISRYYCGYRNGFTAEVDAGVAGMGPADHHPRPGAWRVEWKRAWWLRALSEAGAQVWLDTVACGVQVEGNRVVGVVVAGPCGFGLVRAGCVIDSSGNADLAAAAGARSTQPGVERAAVQGTGLSPRDPGHDYANSDHTFSDDGDLRDATRTFVGARRKFRERFDLTSIVSTRERRRVEADVMLQVEDVFAGRTWPDALHLAKSSFDTHGFTIHPLFTAAPPGRHEQYLAVVPLRALLPRGLDGILVTGLGIGAHRDAMPVVRMQPCVQNQGYAAGLVAVAALAHEGRIRDIPLAPIQDRLVAMGILEPWARTADPFPVDDAVLARAVASEPPEHRALALLFAHRDRALPRLRDALAAATNPVRRVRLAMLLGLMGDAAGSAVLAEAIAKQPWDPGWNYRGMDQFEASRTPLDSLLWAAAGAASETLLPAVSGKLEQLADYVRLALQLELSHAQAMAAACAALSRHDTQKTFPPLLARMLGFHQVTGNHQSDWNAVFSDQPRCVNHNEARNRALRELALAVGLFRCGDHNGMARQVLERYADDWRGPLAHHARSVLRSDKGTQLKAMEL